MRTLKGFHIYEKGEEVVLPKHWPSFPAADPTAKFGFRLVNKGDTAVWQHASEDDFRTALLHLGVSKELVDQELEKRIKGHTICGWQGPQKGCAGDCGVGGCAALLDINGGFLSCYCST